MGLSLRACFFCEQVCSQAEQGHHQSLGVSSTPANLWMVSRPKPPDGCEPEVLEQPEQGGRGRVCRGLAL